MKTNRYLIAPGLLTLALLFALPAATAKEGGKGKEPGKATLKKYDADKDGQLSDEEKARRKEDAQKRHEEREKEMLENYDSNKDGKLDAEEKEKAKADRAAEKEKRKAEHEAKKAAKEAAKDEAKQQE